MKKPISSISFVLALTVATASMARGGELYHFIREIPLGGSEGWDYLTADPAGQRLYVSNGSHVVVVDTAKDAVAGEIGNTLGVHGIALAPELGKGFVSCGKENKAAIVDLKTLEVTSRVDTGTGPDGLLYEPGRKEVYLFNGKGKSVTIIDALEGKSIATIPLGAKPEFPTCDPVAGRVYDNLEDKSEVVVIDTQLHSLLAHWPVAPGEEPSGMAIDTKNHRLFCGCGNKLMVMLDSVTGKVIASVPIGDGVDANAFDPGTQLAFASCGEGVLTIAKEESPDKLTVVQTLKTERGARTMALDTVTHKVYLASAKFEAPEPGQRRGKMIPGSFKISVYGMDK